MYFSTDYRLLDLARPSTALVRALIADMDHRMDLLQRSHGTGEFALSATVAEIKANYAVASEIAVILCRVGYLESESYCGIARELMNARDAALDRRRARLAATA
jgi:hypothetical protein